MWNSGLKRASLSRAERRERALRELQRCRLQDFAESYPYQLSGGMRQRAALARTLAIEPAIVLLDEPFSALDAQTKLILQKSFAQTIASSAITTLLITHDLMEAVIMSDRILVMSERPGRIIEEISGRSARPRQSDGPHIGAAVARIRRPFAREPSSCRTRRRDELRGHACRPPRRRPAARRPWREDLARQTAEGAAIRMRRCSVPPPPSRSVDPAWQPGFGVIFLLAWQFLPPALGVPSYIIPTVTDLVREFAPHGSRARICSCMSSPRSPSPSPAS